MLLKAGEGRNACATCGDSTVDAASALQTSQALACPAEQIRDGASNGDRRLSELGFEGQTIIPGAHGAAVGVT